MKYDLVIYNAKIVTEEEVFLGYICVSDGKIAAMGSDAPVYEAAQSLDAKGMNLFIQLHNDVLRVVIVS